MSNRTHRTRLARALAAATDTSYQAALARVVRAAEAGLLPDTLDEPGMRHALDLLLTPAAGPPTGAAALPPRYHRLAELGVRQLPGVGRRIARAQGMGVEEVDVWDSHDPFEWLDELLDQDDADRATDWWRRIVDAGRRADGRLPSPYPPGSSPDGSVPIDRALDQLERTGDVPGYERSLLAIIRKEPRDIDAYAHLGHLYLNMANGDGDIVVEPAPDQRQQRAWQRTALSHYQTAVGVAELALPDPYTGLLRWTHLGNRPLFRALHGTALALWRLHRYDDAEPVLLNMLWLNPNDNLGARDMLLEVRARRPWTPDLRPVRH